MLSEGMSLLWQTVHCCSVVRWTSYFDLKFVICCRAECFGYCKPKVCVVPLWISFFAFVRWWLGCYVLSGKKNVVRVNCSSVVSFFFFLAVVVRWWLACYNVIR